MVNHSILIFGRNHNSKRRKSKYECTKLENRSDFTENKKKQSKPICDNESDRITTSNERFERFIV